MPNGGEFDVQSRRMLVHIMKTGRAAMCNPSTGTFFHIGNIEGNEEMIGDVFGGATLDAQFVQRNYDSLFGGTLQVKDVLSWNGSCILKTDVFEERRQYSEIMHALLTPPPHWKISAVETWKSTNLPTTFPPVYPHTLVGCMIDDQ